MSSGPGDPAAPSDLVRMSKLLKGFAMNQVIASAVRLDIPSYLCDSDRTADELAELTGIPWQRLAAVLAVLVGLDIARRDEDGLYSATSMTRLLTRATGGMYGQALLSSGMYYTVWADLDHSL